MIYMCVACVTLPLLLLFSRSLSTGVFPTSWKNSKITPIHKKNSRSQIENYRPITNLDAIPKFFEKLIADKLSFTFKHVISKAQHGFMANKSTTTNLVLFKNYIINAWNRGNQVDAIYTDFSKAFDRVDHTLLLRKLKRLGIADPLLSWIRSYLTGRTQYVRINNNVSHSIRVTSGVPQGSHLGPLLFILFINDLPTVLNYSKILMFADDAKLFIEIASEEDHTHLQSDLDSLVTWCDDNRMDLNIGKCQTISFSRKLKITHYPYAMSDEQLSRVQQIKDLGVLLDTKLTFEPHISHIVRKALRSWGFILRTGSKFSVVDTFSTLYKALVRPHLEYASVVWTPFTKIAIKTIEKVQHKYLRTAMFKNDTPMARTSHNYDAAENLCQIQTLRVRRVAADLKFLNCIISGKINDADIVSSIGLRTSRHATRFSQVFHTPFGRTQYAVNDTFIRICDEANKICRSIDFFETNSITFKNALEGLDLTQI